MGKVRQSKSFEQQFRFSQTFILHRTLATLKTGITALVRRWTAPGNDRKGGSRNTGSKGSHPGYLLGLGSSDVLAMSVPCVLKRSTGKRRHQGEYTASHTCCTAILLFSSWRGQCLSSCRGSGGRAFRRQLLYFCHFTTL